MDHFASRVCRAVLAASLLFVTSSSSVQKQQKPKKREKPVTRDVMSFDGGIRFETDGSLSDITCFRLAGRVTSENFFDNFKRIDDVNGTQYHRGTDVLTEFPEELHVSFVMLDFPCASQSEQPGPRRYLTKEMMRTLRFSFYWKRGVALRHVEGVKQEPATAEPVVPYNKESTEELAKRYRWYLEFAIPSAGVPLTDRLVLVIRTPDGHTAARVAARL